MQNQKVGYQIRLVEDVHFKSKIGLFPFEFFSILFLKRAPINNKINRFKKALMVYDSSTNNFDRMTAKS